jgi:glycosyltransferase involved in cell wall biosynthesis
MRLAINASRAKSGGGLAHLIGLLNSASPSSFGFEEVHVWTYANLASKLPKRSWLTIHSPDILDGSLIKQLIWERTRLGTDIKINNCNILLNVDAGTVCNFQPSVTLSRDMLSFEPREMLRYGFSWQFFRLFFLRYVQSRSLRNSTGSIFLTKYASQKIQDQTGSIANSTIIPHGVGPEFRLASQVSRRLNRSESVKLLYISNALPYKHQWNVIDAVKRLRDDGFDVTLSLVGGGTGKAQHKTELKMKECDPQKKFVNQYPFSTSQELVEFLEKSDVFVFASSCENMPNTLVEAMASGIPISCSNKGPMPEVLKDAGIYFDPEDPSSIYFSIKALLLDAKLSNKLAAQALHYSQEYSWNRCAEETFKFLFKAVQISGVQNDKC